jgi:hypothetical protein
VEEGWRAVRDAEYDRLHDAYDALFGGKVHVRGRKAIKIPFRKEGAIARKEALEIVRSDLFRRLHGICRD